MSDPTFLPSLLLVISCTVPVLICWAIYRRYKVALGRWFKSAAAFVGVVAIAITPAIIIATVVTIMGMIEGPIEGRAGASMIVQRYDSMTACRNDAATTRGAFECVETAPVGWMKKRQFIYQNGVLISEWRRWGSGYTYALRTKLLGDGL